MPTQFGRHQSMLPRRDHHHHLKLHDVPLEAAAGDGIDGGTMAADDDSSGQPMSRAHLHRVVAASALGNALEFYDFAIFGSYTAERGQNSRLRRRQQCLNVAPPSIPPSTTTTARR